MQLLDSFFGSKTKVKVLRRLSLQRGWDFSVVELSADLGLNKGVVSKILNQMEKDGTIKTTRKGKMKLCRLNDENGIIKDLVIPAFEKERDALDSVLKRFLKELGPGRFKSVMSVAAYGSVAKGTFRLTSDIDILLVLRDESEAGRIKKALDTITGKFARKEDMVLFCDLMTAKEFGRLYGQNEPSIRDIVRFNKMLYGKDLLELT